MHAATEKMMNKTVYMIMYITSQKWMCLCKTGKKSSESGLLCWLFMLEKNDFKEGVQICTTFCVMHMHEHQEDNHDKLAAVLLSSACRNYKVLSIISDMWHARFN